MLLDLFANLLMLEYKEVLNISEKQLVNVDW